MTREIEKTSVLGGDERIVFARLFGSAAEAEEFNDIAVYRAGCVMENPFDLTSDLKVAL